MHDKKDAEIVREWLTAAIEANAAQSKAPKADLARFCEVSPQVVNGWIKTGRISKGNLTRAVEYFGHAPQFANSPAAQAQEDPYGSWPFSRVSLCRGLALPLEGRSDVEDQLEIVVQKWEGRGRTKRSSGGAA